MMPRGIAGRVYSMARPRRPIAERDAVCAAAIGGGSVLHRATRLARAVALATMTEVDRDPRDDIIRLLAALDPSPISRLATDPEIDTAMLVRSERAKRLEARGGRRLPEAEWPAEDREVTRIVTDILVQRYRSLLRR